MKLNFMISHPLNYFESLIDELDNIYNRELKVINFMNGRNSDSRLIVVDMNELNDLISSIEEHG